jgi:hypothetical protein
MGLWDLLTAGPKMEEIKMSLIGKYVFDKLKDEEIKKQIIEFANNRMKEGYERLGFQHEHTLDEFDPRTKYLFYALAMMELGIDHKVKNFQWSYVKNPLRVRRHDDRLWEASSDVLRKRHGIIVSL